MNKWIWISAALLLTVFLGIGTVNVKGDNQFVSKPDVVIVGTELEGLYLARRAKDEGLKVLVLEPKAKIGGQLLQGQMLYLDATFNAEGKSLIQGEVKKLFDGVETGKLRKLKDFEQYINKLIKGISLKKEAAISNIKWDGKRIASFQYQIGNGRVTTVQPKYIVDNTDDAYFVRQLNVQPLPGLESLYGNKNREYMSATYMMRFKGVDWDKFVSHFWATEKTKRASLYGPETYMDERIAYGFPAIAARYTPVAPADINLRGLNIFNQGDGEIIINALQVYDVDPSKPETVSKAMEITKQEMPFIRDHLKKSIVGFENLELNGEPEYLYIREYNHYPTEYVLQASDVLGGHMFWDNVSVAGYFLDIQGSRSNRQGFAIGRPDQYGIPLRSYLLKDADNVITAGKLVGSSAVAYGSARIQPNGALAAEAIGILMGRKKGASLKEVSQEEMKAFHEYAKTKYGLQLQGRPGLNRIGHLSETDQKLVNEGQITLLSQGVPGRHLPFYKVMHKDKEIVYKGLKPVVIDGNPWVPVSETLSALGADGIRIDVEEQKVYYKVGSREETLATKLHVLNNFVLVHLDEAVRPFGYAGRWNQEHNIVLLEPLNGN